MCFEFGSPQVLGVCVAFFFVELSYKNEANIMPSSPLYSSCGFLGFNKSPTSCPQACNTAAMSRELALCDSRVASVKSEGEAALAKYDSLAASALVDSKAALAKCDSLAASALVDSKAALAKCDSRVASVKSEGEAAFFSAKTEGEAALAKCMRRRGLAVKYNVVGRERTFEEAKQLISSGCRMVSRQDVMENHAALSEFASGQNYQMWVDARRIKDTITGDRFEWGDSHRMVMGVVGHWARGEPNNASEGHVVMRPNGQLNDVRGDTTRVLAVEACPE